MKRAVGKNAKQFWLALKAAHYRVLAGACRAKAQKLYRFSLLILILAGGLVSSAISLLI